MRRRTATVWSHPREHRWWDVIVPEFTPEEFIQNFRVSRESFEYICRRLRHMLERKDTNFRLSVPVKKRVAIALCKLATGSEYRYVSQLFGVGVSTVFNCVQDFCSAVIKILVPVHMKFPSPEKLKEMADVFENCWNVPQCIGSIDAHHIPIIAPEKNPRGYLNRKGWHSVVLQAVVDGNGLFWDLCVGFSGNLSDARVLRQSYLWSLLSERDLLNHNKVDISGCDVGYYLIGDSAYPLQNWLMKPFPDIGGLTPQQESFNSRLSSARSVSDLSFKKLKARWQCLFRRNDCKVELVKKMALTCCVLHNICEEKGTQFSEDHSTDHLNLQPPVQEFIENGQPEGTDVREALSDFFIRQSDIIQVVV
ncbi:uncharacterized protein isoform X1 [Danio rerio]